VPEIQLCHGMMAADEMRRECLMSGGVGPVVHRSEFQTSEGLAAQSDAPLLEEHRSRRQGFDAQSQGGEQGR
jgi:hypothetical protein